MFIKHFARQKEIHCEENKHCFSPCEVQSFVRGEKCEMLDMKSYKLNKCMGLEEVHTFGWME